ncbi:hypothetical protein DSL72_002071 [Monilinia vaccinii-corymbosi]|uniref:Uncharacterized protein n=1 Tax=Monilinia vaccinii-corymbosi TaxID=61207 RepID=A0A8A3PBL9_9HELO|nr:hypothetical protein DSL72_002071 [Monilinia vaccinii-corymbosi]
MPPPVPVPIPLASSSQTQIVPKIQDDDQLPDNATLRTLSSFIKSYQSPTQSTISIPLQSTSTTPTPPTPLVRPLTQTGTTQPRNQHLKMAHTTTTVTTRPSFLARLRGAKAHQRTYENSTHGTHHRHNHTTAGTTTGARRQRTWGRRRAGVTAQPVHHHHHRKPSVGDKISGAMMKLRGSLTRRPGLKAAGTRRMRGTDEKGSHHVAAY